MKQPDNKAVLGKGGEPIMPFLVTLYAGWYAETIIDQNALLEEEHAHSDGMVALKYAVAAICTPIKEAGLVGFSNEEIEAKQGEIDELLEKAKRRASRFVEQFADAIATVADQLLAERFLDGTDVVRMVRANMPKP